jgi:RNA polymerase sigma factor (sigma-70 family)
MCQPHQVVGRLSDMTNDVSRDVLSAGDWSAGPQSDASADDAREVVDALFRRHYLALLRLGVVMVGSREAAEDAVQDAFAALYRNWRSLRDAEDAETYLRSAVLNRCRSWVRRQATQKASRPLMLVREQHESPEDTIVSRDEVGSLVAVMRTLARRQREVLACRLVLEMSIAETAQLLGISEGSVKTHAHRGLQTLHERIEEAR